jgi:LysR family glycine cleavage system transcriptional activator
MQINLNQLRAFYMAVHYKSISTAAEQLYVTPAAVSMQIKKLEQWLGKRLLERSGNTFTVTEEGMALQAYAQNIFNEVERLEHNIMVRRRDQAGELRIGMHHFPAQYFMPTILMGLKKKGSSSFQVDLRSCWIGAASR